MDDIEILTEAINPTSSHIDQISTLEMVQIINTEDQKVAFAVREALPQIAQAIDLIADRMRRGGRMIYLGAGTSGRLGVLDASEIPPTFNTDPNQTIAVIAGGPRAIQFSVEDAEDEPDSAVEDLKRIGIGPLDSLIGITASGRTPYVIGGLKYAREQEALCIGLACNLGSQIGDLADLKIEVPVGPEVISGSTRMKAGTAQKMVLNMISTGVMVRLGKTYGNLMVDVRQINSKLRTRARGIVREATGADEQQAADLLARCDGEVKTAIVVALLGCEVSLARRYLELGQGVIRQALELGRKGAQA